MGAAAGVGADPSGADTVVLLVNSGSEAVEVAVKAAQAAVQRRVVMTVREAYHGWTLASDALTTESLPLLPTPVEELGRSDWVSIA